MEDGAQFLLLLSTAGSLEEASKIADHLVSRRLVACVNIVPAIQSVYWWNNQIQRENEVLMVMKTKAARLPDIEKEIRAIHSYEVPELLAMPIHQGLAQYLKWVDESVP